MGKNRLNRWLILIFLLLGFGCVSLPPVKTDLSRLTENPSLYADQPVEFPGYVKRNKIEGDEYVSWFLILEEGGKEIFCEESGWNASVIRQAWDLAEQAKEERGLLTATGTVLANSQEMERGLRILLSALEYKGQKILTDYDDFPPRPYVEPFYWFSRPFHHYYYGPWDYGPWDFPYHFFRRR